MSDDRQSILRRRARFIVVALAGAGLDAGASGCGRKPDAPASAEAPTASSPAASSPSASSDASAAPPPSTTPPAPDASPPRICLSAPNPRVCLRR